MILFFERNCFETKQSNFKTKETDLNKKYKVIPNIYWTEFKKGCN